MITDLIKYFENKKILILGFGREGQSTYKLVRKYLKDQKIYIADKKENFQNNYDFLREDKNSVYISGENYLNNLNEFDIIMKSPGISFVGIDTNKFLSKVKSQLELLLEYFKVFTIGITGTKGKSTTSSLIYKVLQEQNIKTKFLGNIGIPVFDYIDEIEENMTIVLEMSSHQLEYMDISPNIAILLNIFEEHLDHYESFEKYADAKCNIYKFQKNTDYFIYNSDNEVLKNIVKDTNGTTYKVSLKGNENANVVKNDENIFINNRIIYNINEKRNLLGDYNLNNIMFVLAVSEILKLDINQTIKSIADFKTLEHRLELVGKYDGVLYYDNSIGTIPEATIEAVKALKQVDTLIIGGMDRGIDYTGLIEFLNNSTVNNIICMPQTGHDIAKELKQEKVHIAQDLEEAVKTAKKVTKKDMICLLSPAAASYGFFKNFEERGKVFCELVKEEGNF